MNARESYWRCRIETAIERLPIETKFAALARLATKLEQLVPGEVNLASPLPRQPTGLELLALAVRQRRREPTGAAVLRRKINQPKKRK